jgi:hypothetical protein
LGIRTLQDQILTKVISIPISISATALAVYNLDNNQLFIYLVLIAYCFYSIFTTYLLRLLYIECKESRISFEVTVKELQIRTPFSVEELNEETSKLRSKFNQVEFAIVFIQTVLTILAFLLLFFTFKLQNTSIEVGVMFEILIIIFHLMASLFWLNKTKISE